MRRIERVELAIRGKNVDRVPVSVWMHFSEFDQDPRRLAEVQVAFNEKYDFDFIKLMPFGLYTAQDWGAQIKFFCRAGGEPIIYRYGINRYEDYLNLHELPPHYGTLGKQVQLVEHMAKVAPPHTPYLMTIFSPITTLHKLAGERLFGDLVEFPSEVKKALEVITVTTMKFGLMALKSGIAGFFFATQNATRSQLTVTQFNEFCRPYDLQILNALCPSSLFNILHIHGKDIMFDQILDYPCNCLNWHDRDTEPSLQNARAMTSKCFVGGIREVPYFEGRVLKYDSILRQSTPEEITIHVHEAIKSVNGKGLMIAPGCVADPATPESNLYAVRRAVEI